MYIPKNVGINEGRVFSSNRKRRQNIMVRIIFLSLLLVPAYVQAQNNTNDTFSATWFNAGTGVSTSGVSFIGGISHQIDASLLSVRGTASNILFGDEFWDIGMLYGRTTDSRKFHQSISIGLGIVGGIRREGGLFSLEPIETEKIPLTPNIPIELKMYWRPFRYFGLGTYFFANLNTEHSNIGGALSIKIGKMW